MAKKKFDVLKAFDKLDKMKESGADPEEIKKLQKHINQWIFCKIIK